MDYSTVVLILWVSYFLVITIVAGRPLRRRPLPAVASDAPQICVLLPVRGLSASNETFVDRLMAQDYPRFRVLLLVESDDDPASQLMARPGMAERSALVVAGLATCGAQKMTNLLAGIDRLRPEDEIVVFCDADSLVPPDWLTRLTDPIRRGEVEVATTFRLLLPRRPRLGSCTYAAADVALSLAPRRKRPLLCWGGSTAVLASRLPALELRRRWQAVYNDDLVLSEGVAAAGLKGCVLPDLRLPTLIDFSLPAALRFERRQLLNFRLYFPIASLLISAAFVLPLVFWISATVKWASGVALAPYAMGAVFLLDGLRAWLRLRTIRANSGPELARHWRCAALLAWLLPLPLALLRLYAAIAAWRVREVEWAGITYDVRKPRDVRILARKPPAAYGD